MAVTYVLIPFHMCEGLEETFQMVKTATRCDLPFQRNLGLKLWLAT